MDCNGWKNRETWLVNLWFGDNFAMDADDGIAITANYIREAVENYIDEIVPQVSFVADLIDLREVDWEALAAHHARDEIVVEG
jgi:hypothetical protein